MKEIITFISVLLAFGLLITWFKVAEIIGDKFNSSSLGFWLALGVPLAILATIIVFAITHLTP